MEEISVKRPNHIITQDELKMAENNYKTEKFEEMKWEETLDDVNCEINVKDVQLDSIEKELLDLNVCKNNVSGALKEMNENYNNMVETHDKLKKVPLFKLKKEEVEFLKNYDQNKRHVEVQIHETEIRIKDLDHQIESETNNKLSADKKRSMLETHRDSRVAPKLKEETEEADKAYNYWQDLEKAYKEQEVKQKAKY